MIANVVGAAGMVALLVVCAVLLHRIGQRSERRPKPDA